MSETSSTAMLLLGGTGKIARRLSPLLTARGVFVLLASRTPKKQSHSGCRGVRFDWLNPDTYQCPFDIPSITISTIFLIPPLVPDAFPLIKVFIDIAIDKKVKRIVLLSGSVLHVGDGPALNAVAEENFSEMNHHVTSITEQNCIISGTGNGKLPFISADDIAEVACLTMTDQTLHNTEYLLFGPELLSYDQVAEILSANIGRHISHAKITQQEVAAGMIAGGMDEIYAKGLSELETYVKTGGEERMNDDVLKLTGRPPRSFKDYVQQCVKQNIWKVKEANT
ncbi:hypothetical protein B7463_g12021, partial [Scytalidium lignicola]